MLISEANNDAQSKLAMQMRWHIGCNEHGMITYSIINTTDVQCSVTVDCNTGLFTIFITGHEINASSAGILLEYIASTDDMRKTTDYCQGFDNM